MRVRIFTSLFVLAGAAASATEIELALDQLTAREILIPPPAATVQSLVEAKIEPTKHELRADEVFVAEKWEQEFMLAARLPVDDAISLRQEVRTGLQSETILGQELASAYRDALAMLDKTSAELRASEALRLAISAQQQWLATNSVPFAEIVTYGAEAAFTPAKTTTLKLQVERQERNEFAATISAQEIYRLALQHEFFPKQLQASASVAFAQLAAEDALHRESVSRRLETALRWTPFEQTALILGAGVGEEETLTAETTAGNYAVKIEHRLLPGARLELQAGFEQQARAALDTMARSGAWNLGTQSAFTLRDDWAAGIGVRYRQRHESSLQQPEGELSLSLSLKGRF